MPTYTGTSATDYITGSSGNDTIYGLGGNDSLDGGSGADVVRGGDGNDTIIGGPLFENSYDWLYGENGDDTITGGAGDVIDGGSGTDLLNGDYRNAATGLTIDFSTIWSGGSITVAGGAITNMERLGTIYGSNYNDSFTTGSLAGSSASLFGWSGNDVLTGGAGGDWLEGSSYGGNADTNTDLLYGLDGNDLLGGGVNDTLDGGNGIDSVRLDFSAATAGVAGDFTAVLGGSTATIGGITLAGIEHIQTVLGSAYGDLFDASADAYGGSAWGSTAIYGYGGNDILTGNAAGNVLDGGIGDDILTGGAARDLLTGGGGADAFRFASGDFGGATATTADLIFDFSQTEGDRIDVSAVDAVAGGADDAFAFLGTGAFTGVAGQLRYDYSGTQTVVYGDIDGNGIADFAIALTGTIALVSGDFHL